MAQSATQEICPTHFCSRAVRTCIRWAYISGALGDFPDQLPNIGELAGIVARELGGPNYWRAPVEPAYLSNLTPKVALDRYWLYAQKLLTTHKRDILDWRLDVAFAGQIALNMMCRQIAGGNPTKLPAPGVLARLMLWSAMTTAKLHPKTVAGAICAAEEKPELKGLTTRTGFARPKGKAYVVHRLRDERGGRVETLIALDEAPDKIFLKVSEQREVGGALS